jgi:hypothetical protein
LTIAEVAKRATVFHGKKYVMIFRKKFVEHNFRRFFSQIHPVTLLATTTTTHFCA